MKNVWRDTLARNLPKISSIYKQNRKTVVDERHTSSYAYYMHIGSAQTTDLFTVSLYFLLFDNTLAIS